MVANLKHQMVSGMAWRGLERMGSSFVQFVVSIVMARLLLPEQFGMIAMIAVLVEVPGILVDGEFPAALIQKKERNPVSESSVFIFNLVVACSAYLVLYAIAPLVARFYGETQLVLILRVLSLRLIISAFGIVPKSLLMKQVDFRKLLIVGWGSLLAGAATGILMARSGYGVWALVAQQLVSVSMGSVIVWWLAAWQPVWRFSFAQLGELFRYGSKLLISRFMDTVFGNLYMVVIGRLYSPVALGFYHRGDTLPGALTGPVVDTVSAVLFPSYASMQHDTALMRKAAHRSLNLLYFVLAPLLVGLCMTAEPVVRFLLTEKWLPCVPYVRIISICCLFVPFHIINLQVIRALGRSDIYLKLEIVKILIEIAVIAVLFRFGLLVLIMGQIVTSVLSMVVNSFYSKRFIGYSTLRQLIDTAPVTLIAILMAAVVWIVGRGTYGSDLLQIVLQVVCGAVIYVGSCFVFKVPSLFQTIDLFKEYVLHK